MGLTGKYDFSGIKKAGIVAIEAALASTSWGASLIGGPFRAFEEALLGAVINWLANKGLIVLNLGAIVINGEVDQTLFDMALDEGLKKVEQGRDLLSDAEGRAIDDDVIQAARRFIPFQS